MKKHYYKFVLNGIISLLDYIFIYIFFFAINKKNRDLLYMVLPIAVTLLMLIGFPVGDERYTLPIIITMPIWLSYSLQVFLDEEYNIEKG